MMQQYKIIYTLGVRPVIDPSIEIRIIINFLKSYLKKYDCLRSYIVGISGGQDSTLTGKLCQLAINELKKETGSLVYKFIAVRLPYGYQEDEQDCLDAISFIQPDEILTVNIKDAVLTSIKSLLNVGIEMNDFVKGNQKARERMKILYSISNINSGLVVGTTNAAEFLTGFFTKYGDHGTDINPILRLNKRQGRLLLKYLNCPSNLYFKIPTADLEDNRPLLSDEIVLGITYDAIDDYLEGKVIDKKEIITIENLYNQNQHKRCLPIRLFG